MRLNVEVYTNFFPIEVLPSDTIWTLKWKIYENEDIRKYCSENMLVLPPSPDDQELVIDGEETVLNNCERSLESYSIHEGSELQCKWREGCDSENYFPSLLDVYRKKKTEAICVSVSFVKHGSIHFHEVQSIRLQWGSQSHHIQSFFHHVIHSMSSLKKLDVSENTILNEEEWTPIAESLSNNTSLKTLDLSNCGIRSGGAIRIAQMLQKNSSLANLDLTWNHGIGDEGWCRIAEALETNTSLKTLSISGCGVMSDGGKRIAQMLEKNSSLVSLNLGGNSGISDEGWSRIAEALEINTSLQTLDLSRCAIGSVGAIRIAQMLQKNSSLFCLNLRGNWDIKDKECISIAEALENNIGLKILDLSNCLIGTAGAAGIAQMLVKNSTLLSLDLMWSASIGCEGWVRIAEALESNISLKTLEFHDATETVGERIRSILMRNRTSPD